MHHCQKRYQKNRKKVEQTSEKLVSAKFFLVMARTKTMIGAYVGSYVELRSIHFT